MKLVFFDDFKLGVVNGDTVTDVSDAVADIPSVSPQDTLSGLISDFDSYKGKLEQSAASGDGIPSGAKFACAHLRPDPSI